MWVDKDDMFADDKIWEFKHSTPDSETHIRRTSSAKSPYPSAPTRSQLLSLHASHYMSSDGHDELAYEPTARAIADSPIPFSQEHPINTPVLVPIPIIDFTTLQSLSAAAPVFSPRPVTASSSASDVATMFRQLRVHTLAPLTPDGQCVADQANKMFAVSFTSAEGQGDQTSVSLEPGAAHRPAIALGATAATMHQQGSDPYDLSADNDLRCCARCGEQ
jgi:hypothetical protein